MSRLEFLFFLLAAAVCISLVVLVVVLLINLRRLGNLRDSWEAAWVSAWRVLRWLLFSDPD